MSKVSVIGAGAVGTAVSYALSNQTIVANLALYDIDAVKVAAEAADLSHGAALEGLPRVSGSDELQTTADSDVVVITAGANRSPGQSRLELAAHNAQVVSTLAESVLELSPRAILIVVTNPCDVLATVLSRQLDVPPSQIISSGTLLDSARLRSALARRFAVSPASIDVVVAGEHGDSQVPIWSTATIGGVPIGEAHDLDGRPLSPTELDEVAQQTKDAGRQVIEGKGVTNFGIGQSVAWITRSILLDERVVLPAGTLVHGWTHSEVVMSVPSVVAKQGAVPVPGWRPSQLETERLHASAQAIAEVVESLSPGTPEGSG